MFVSTTSPVPRRRLELGTSQSQRSTTKLQLTGIRHKNNGCGSKIFEIIHVICQDFFSKICTFSSAHKSFHHLCSVHFISSNASAIDCSNYDITHTSVIFSTLYLYANFILCIISTMFLINNRYCCGNSFKSAPATRACT